MTERKRQVVYYLDQIWSNQIALHEDGSVGELAYKKREVTRSLPSRTERMRTVTEVEKSLAQVAVSDSLRNHMAQRPIRSGKDAQHGRDYTWELGHFPDDMVAEFAEWCDNPPYTLDDIRQSANLAPTPDHEELMDCPDCPADARYACYTSGMDRQIYRYPNVDIGEETPELVPFDIAQIIAGSPEAIGYEVDFYAERWKGNQLRGRRYLVCDLSQLPYSAFGIQREGTVSVHGSDKISSKLKIPVDEWSENGFASTGGEKSVTEKDWQADTARERVQVVEPSAKTLLENIQRKVALDVLERPEKKDYDALYRQLLHDLANAGLTLMYDFSSNDVGEPAAEYYISHAEHGSNFYGEPIMIARGIDSRDGVQKAREAYVRGAPLC